MASLPDSPLSEEEYLRIERLAETKSEYHDGRMYPMSGGTYSHSALSTRMCVLLDRGLPRGCRTLNSDMRIKVAPRRMYTYADALVICGEPQFAGDQKDIILNPLLIVEVLSPSTESYDRGTKFALYRTIRTFREYLVVHQDQRWVEHHSKQDDGGWLLHEYTEGAITIPSLQIEISLQDLYSVAVGLE